MKNVTLVIFILLITISFHSFANWEGIDEIPVDDIPKPGGIDEITRVVDQAIEEHREYMKRVEAHRQKWFERQAMPGHSMRVLPDGESLYKARYEILESAKKSIFISTYSYYLDIGGEPIRKILCSKAAEGVDVRVLIDGWGGKKFRKYRKKMHECGVYLLYYWPLEWDLAYAPHGLHDKILIVDGEKYIIGGSNYARHYRIASRESKKWYDLDLLVEGPSACWFHNVFRDVYLETVDRVDGRYGILGGIYSPERLNYYFGLDEVTTCVEKRAGTSRVLPLYGNPIFYKKKRPLLDAYIDAILATRKNSRIVFYAPYFVPHDRLVAGLLWARSRGVEVEILTNSPISTDESNIVIIGMLYKVRKLMNAGVKLLNWSKKSTLHRKGGVFDGRWAFFGSDNMDVRGQDWATESIVFTDDKAIVRELEREFELDLKHTTLVTKEWVKNYMKGISPARKWLVRKILLDFL